MRSGKTSKEFKISSTPPKNNQVIQFQSPRHKCNCLFRC